MSRLTSQEIADRAKEHGSWFQNVRLHGVETNLDRPDLSAGRWELLEPLLPQDLAGRSVLDLGCNAGYFAIKMKQRGADVLGVDWFPEAIEQARFAAHVLELDIEYRVENIYDFVLRTRTRFDYVIFLGVFYHLRYPLLILDRLAELTRRELYFQTVIKETPDGEDLTVPDDVTDFEVFDHPAFPSLYFVENNLTGAFNNWFVCNRSAANAVLRSAGFRDIRSRGDVFACSPDSRLDEAWRSSHALAAIKSSEPLDNAS